MAATRHCRVRSGTVLLGVPARETGVKSAGRGGNRNCCYSKNGRREYSGEEQTHNHLSALLYACCKAGLKCAMAFHVPMLGPHECDQSHSGHARDQTIVIGRLDRDDVRRCVVAQPLVLFDIV